MYMIHAMRLSPIKEIECVQIYKILCKKVIHGRTTHTVCHSSDMNSFKFYFSPPLSCSGISKGGLGSAQALPSACCALPLSLHKDQGNLIKYSQIFY